MNLLFPIIALLGLSFLSSNKSSNSTVKKSKSGKIKFGLFKSPGVSQISYETSKTLLENSNNVDLKIITANDIRNGALNDREIVLFGGGSGSAQGKDLKESGREIIKTWINNGGNYIGICGGSYLALQGSEEFNKLGMVAGKNFGDYWQRGIGTSELQTNDNQQIFLHYENGPVFDKLEVPGLPPFVSLATFVSDYYVKSKGTLPGEMPGKPAIVISQYGKGKVLLFSPNPLIDDGNTYHSELIINGANWMLNNSNVNSNLKFSQIFGV